MHADEHNADTQKEIHSELMTKQGPTHDGCEDSGDGAAVLLQYRVSKLQQDNRRQAGYQVSNQTVNKLLMTQWLVKGMSILVFTTHLSATITSK